MIIGPKISKRFVNVMDDKQLQQCGIDLRVGEIYKLSGRGVLDYTNEKRELPKYQRIFSSEEDMKISLDRGVYLVKIADKLKIPKDIAGFAYPRSSLLRMGCTLHTAVHDPGYEGHPIYLMEVLNPITIYKYARIAQIVYIKCSDTIGTYCGVYQEKE